MDAHLFQVSNACVHLWWFEPVIAFELARSEGRVCGPFGVVVRPAAAQSTGPGRSTAGPGRGGWPLGTPRPPPRTICGCKIYVQQYFRLIFCV